MKKYILHPIGSRDLFYYDKNNEVRFFPGKLLAGTSAMDSMAINLSRIGWIALGSHAGQDLKRRWYSSMTL